MASKRNKGKNRNYVTEATIAKKEQEEKQAPKKKQSKFVKTMLKSTMFRNLARSKEVRVMVYIMYGTLAVIALLVLYSWLIAK